MAEARIGVDTIDGVGLVTICGSNAQNAVTGQMWQALAEAIERLQADADIRVLVLTGAGHTAFASDPDTPEQAGEREVVQRLRAGEKPLIARLRGTCLGAGLALALCADIRIAAADTAFAITGPRAAALGLEAMLVETIGMGQARAMLLTGDRIEAEAALRIGLVSRVVPDGELSDTVADLARQLADADAQAMAETKRALARFSRPG